MAWDVLSGVSKMAWDVLSNSLTLAIDSYLPTYKLRQVYIHTSTTHIIS